MIEEDSKKIRQPDLGIVIGDSDTFLRDTLPFLRNSFHIECFEPKGLADFQGRRRIPRILHDAQYVRFARRQDVILFEWASQACWRAAKVPTSTPNVVRLLGYEMHTWATDIRWDRVDMVIVLLEAVKLEFARNFPEHAHKCIVLPVGVDLSTLGLAKRDRSLKTIGTLGYLTPRKRVYELILAFAELIDEGLDIELSVAGGHLPEHVRDVLPIHRLPSLLKIEDRVNFEGFVPDLEAWFGGIDLFVSNSYAETQHVALQQAMGTGCPCLVHRWDGADEVAPEHVLFDTPSSFKSEVRRLASMESSERNREGAELRDFVARRFDSAIVIPKLKSVLLDLANQGPKSR